MTRTLAFATAKLPLSLLLPFYGSTQIFTDNFNRADNTTVGIGWTELETAAPGSAQTLANRLQLGSTTSGREFVYRDVSSLYTTNGITTNTGSIVWAFNFRQTTTSPSGFDGSNCGMAFILGSTSNTTTLGDGYAVVLGQRDNYTNAIPSTFSIQFASVSKEVHQLIY